MGPFALIMIASLSQGYGFPNTSVVTLTYVGWQIIQNHWTLQFQIYNLDPINENMLDIEWVSD